MNGMMGKKIGMTRVFGEDGQQVPVTVLEVQPCKVVQTKTVDKDGYTAVQIGYGSQKEHRLTKAQLVRFKKAKVDPCRLVKEFRVEDSESFEVGSEINAGIFEGVSHVDVVGVTKGRGFQGVVRRHGMSGGRGSHGSGNHRKPGSIGQCTFPSRVFKNRKMPGHMGHVRVTTQNLKVVELRPEEGLILVRGAVPGPNGGIVVISKSIKKKATPSS